MNEEATSNSRRNPPDLSAKITGLAFCWGNPALIEYYLNLTDWLKDQGGMEFVFITTNPQGKFYFLQRGATAFTIKELVETSASYPDLDVPGEDLKKLSDYDREIGFNWIAKKTFPGRADDAESYFQWQAQKILTAFSFLIDAVKPNVVLTWTGAMLAQTAPAYLARKRGIPCFFLERGLLPGTLVVDTEGVNYASSIAGEKWDKLAVPCPSGEEAALARQYCQTLGQEGKTVVATGKELTPDELREALQIEPDHKVILFPLQIEWDSNILKYSPHYKSMTAIIADLQKALHGREDVVLVIKPHPEDKERYSELRALLGPRSRMSVDLALHSLLRVADVVVTINSTVGLEALAQRKPVVTLGKAIYGEKGFTLDLSAPGELKHILGRALQDAQDRRFNEQEFFRFLIRLLKHHLFSLAQTDPLASRQNIAQQIILAARQAEIPSTPAPPAFDLLRDRNREIMELLSVSRAPTPSPLAFLLIGPEPAFAELITRTFPGARIDLLGAWNIWSRALALPLTRYDYAMSFGNFTWKEKTVWSLVRARRKWRF